MSKSEHGRSLSREQIESGVYAANIPALLMTVYQFTGDRSWMSEEFHPTRARGLDDNDSGGLSPQAQQKVRDAAVDTFLRLQAGEAPAISTIEPGWMVQAMAVYTGESVAPEYGSMLAHEFARRAGLLIEPGRRPGPGSDFRVAIIGAGVGGISAARRCQELGIDFVLIDREAAPGGVWRKNVYPGAGVDTPSHLYSLSFAKHDWSTHYALRDEIEQYLHACFEQIVARGADVRLGAAVEGMAWSSAEAMWRLALASGEEIIANAVISCVGGLDVPSVPDVPGKETFAGTSFHSAQWPQDLELQGKRVVVVGTGASAMQIVPAIADDVDTLTIIQRSPQWVAPFEKFRKPIPANLRSILATFPLYYGWYWLRQFWQFGDNVLESLRKDPDWPHPERAVSERNDGHRKFFTAYVKEKLGDRIDLLPDVLPDYPPFGKRILLDNGWFTTLCRPNVELVSGGVVAVDAEGVRSTKGYHAADIVVWATGFQVSRFVGTVDVVGRTGRSLREAWDANGSRSYLGIAVPEFPNFFTLGGPNSFPGSGSLMFGLELQAQYVCRLIAEMIDAGKRSIDVKDDVHRAYNDLIDAEHARMVWTHPGMDTYYRDEAGRVVFVSPLRNVDFWERLSRSGLEDYEAG